MRKNTEKLRIVTLLTQEEKEQLEELAWRSGRSVAGYVRALILEDIEANFDKD